MSRYSFYEHDNRANNYRVARPMGRQRRKYRDNNGRRTPSFPGGRLPIDTDGDIDMASGVSINYERRYLPYNQQQSQSRRKYKKNKKYEHGDFHSDVDGTVWFRITIPHGKKSGKSFILKSITSLCKVPFTPFNFQFSGNAAEFFVNDYAVARQIKDVNRRVTTPDGFKMVVLMARSAPPVSVIDPEISEMIKTCMSAHYHAPTHSLDLTKFHVDDSLKAQGLYVPLHKPIVFSTVVKIIKEHIPELVELNLSENRLYSLEALSILVPVCKQLKKLILYNNKLKFISELNHIKGMEVLELNLDGNPLCDDYTDKGTYISSVRERLPKLISLDGQQLPAPIGFDLGTETLPVSKKSFFLAEDVKDMVVQFLDQYYTIYDSGDRSKLLEAYHDQANFSLSMSKHTKAPGSNSSLNAYNLDNRNLLTSADRGQRFKLLKQGRLSVVSVLSELPQTMHDPSSFSVDVFHISPGLMSFVVTGVFKEVGADINNASLKTFSRTFVVAALGQGFVIVNETLYIAHASTDQQSKAFKLPAPTPSPSPAPSTEEKSPAEKQFLVVELAKQTGMNLDFSTKCLEENDWDFQRAAAVFMKFQAEGKIPPDAFIA